MKSIKVNNKVVAVPAETIVEYLEYRKINKELEKGYSEGLNQAQDNLAQNIMIWANDIAGLNTSLPELALELEKIALELI
ncbi:hypothetical protein [Streptococcus gallolyticus]|uniref:hypothetical protein n=1 Tax=Streptococcus gallolyticus TaxID=315405 RepID=UPI0022834E5B|nr:hypothetical protein [Streptococcus gallolyticus]MCY7173691.1 hypothetical protein [Streptococcus gallolyticus subsp. gallolyticus]MCY7175812.1 hypothetical protein [Streptococcus gallolyticus subsp. gallolyticus]MCY7180266.1 hypothetical protein [Streptococcus gallolyticus subsp. gallolyticus]MCY7184843.1 hypothetical protein [Streptococcus gallolyticus subsp. gallolyticus]MCY7190047.1 hypothetical protein [Streptococcus gallolyticus subsp. gallolyticus]